MTRPHKFQPGEPFLTTDEAVRAIMNGEWVYHRHKPTHPGWAMGWPLILIKGFVGGGHLRRAILTEYGRASRTKEQELETV
jgi:hypothetical protein